MTSIQNMRNKIEGNSSKIVASVLIAEFLSGLTLATLMVTRILPSGKFLPQNTQQMIFQTMFATLAVMALTLALYSAIMQSKNLKSDQVDSSKTGVKNEGFTSDEENDLLNPQLVTNEGNSINVQGNRTQNIERNLNTTVNETQVEEEQAERSI
ncbi:MAG: hypothetical protein HRK26_00575 [Rickettsiaceae bacterium H1]|nr:hypothetical protein [Rickettsiaceae bacterium H1]